MAEGPGRQTDSAVITQTYYCRFDDHISTTLLDDQSSIFLFYVGLVPVRIWWRGINPWAFFIGHFLDVYRTFPASYIM